MAAGTQHGGSRRISMRTNRMFSDFGIKGESSADRFFVFGCSQISCLLASCTISKHRMQFKICIFLPAPRRVQLKGIHLLVFALIASRKLTKPSHDRQRDWLESTRFKSGETIGLMCDMDKRTVSFYKNGSLMRDPGGHYQGFSACLCACSCSRCFMFCFQKTDQSVDMGFDLARQCLSQSGLGRALSRRLVSRYCFGVCLVKVHGMPVRRCFTDLGTSPSGRVDKLQSLPV